MKRMKFERLQKVVGILVILFLVIIAGLAIFSGYSADHRSESAELYFISATNHVGSEYRKIEAAPPEEMAQQILEELKAGPKTEGFFPAIPEELNISVTSVQNGQVEVDLGKEYYSLDNVSEVIFRSTVVWSLTSLDFIDRVHFTVEGRELLRTNGEAFGVMDRNTIKIDGEISAENTEYAVLYLYFANENYTDLQIEERIVEINTNLAKENTIIEQLLLGPEDAHCRSTIASDVQLREITTTSDGICYVNLSQDFLTKTIANEYLTIYSIVNSLCSLDNVDKVQFLIEGKRMDLLNGRIDISQPFSATADVSALIAADNASGEK